MTRRGRSDSFGEDEKEQFKKMIKKERKKCVITLRKNKRKLKKKWIRKEKKAKHDNLDDNQIK